MPAGGQMHAQRQRQRDALHRVRVKPTFAPSRLKPSSCQSPCFLSSRTPPRPKSETQGNTSTTYLETTSLCLVLFFLLNNKSIIHCCAVQCMVQEPTLKAKRAACLGCKWAPFSLPWNGTTRRQLAKPLASIRTPRQPREYLGSFDYLEMVSCAFAAYD